MTDEKLSATFIPARHERERRAIERARDLYTLDTDDIEIDDVPAVSAGDDGVWVNAWVWVPDKGPDDLPEDFKGGD